MSRGRVVSVIGEYGHLHQVFDFARFGVESVDDVVFSRGTETIERAIDHHLVTAERLTRVEQARDEQRGQDQRALHASRITVGFGLPRPLLLWGFVRWRQLAALALRGSAEAAGQERKKHEPDCETEKGEVRRVALVGGLQRKDTV
jgi:hypothetical protein